MLHLVLTVSHILDPFTKERGKLSVRAEKEMEGEREREREGKGSSKEKPVAWRVKCDTL